MPVSADGGLVDIHVTAFLTAIDGLLTAGRSPAPSRVLPPMRTVLNAVSAIVDDVRQYERRQSRDSDNDAVRSLRDRTEATLSNLVTASKTHATSMGMSPVSLLDAAASHLSAAVTELGKMVLIRKATKAEQDQFEASLTSNSNASFGANGFVPTLRSIDEIRLSSSSSHQRVGSSASRKSNDTSSPIPTSLSELQSPPLPSSMLGENLKRRPMTPSSSVGSSPPPLFDQSRTNATTSDDSAAPEGPDDAWTELKVRCRILL
jgi:protein SPA2